MIVLSVTLLETLEELKKLNTQMQQLIQTTHLPPGWRHNPQKVLTKTLTTSGDTKKMTVFDTDVGFKYKKGAIISGYVALQGAQAVNVRHIIRVHEAPLEFNFTETEMAALGFPTTPAVNMFWYSAPGGNYYTIFSAWNPWLPWQERVTYTLDNEGTADVTHEESLYAVVEHP